MMLRKAALAFTVTVRTYGKFAVKSRLYPFPVLGIETSCDDTAVCILSSDRKVLSSRRYANREVQNRLGGICPSVSAEQHRSLIDNFVEECLYESGKRLSDLAGIAVTTRPGLVITLKVGIDKALSLARKGRVPLIKVHHMQAHATAVSLSDQSVSFPFLALLISGGHSLIALANGPDRFEILATSKGSPGECLDKIARTLLAKADILKQPHSGAAIELLASSCSSEGRLRYRISMPASNGPHFNFDSLKSAYLSLLNKEKKKGDVDINDFCASVQHSVAGHLATKVHHCLEYLSDEGLISQLSCLVVSGGVASNAYIKNSIEKVAAFHGLRLVAPPPHLCTDNAEMIAWNAVQLLNERSPAVIEYDRLPISLFAEARSPIGLNIGDRLPQRPRRRLSVMWLARDKVVFSGKPNISGRFVNSLP